MKNATYSNPLYQPAVVRFHAGRVLAVLGLFLLLGGGVALWFLSRHGGSKAAPKIVETTTTPTHVKQALTLKPEEPEPVKTVALPAEPAKPVTPPPDRSADILRELAAIKQDVDALKRRPTPGTPPPGTKPPPKPPGSMLFVSHDLKDAAPGSKVKEYLLAPGATKIPCVLETKIVSDVEGVFTCRVTTNIFDSATGRHLVIPQGSTVLGTDHASELVYGNERLNTVSLKLAFPDGRSVDLGKAPITDQQGVAGLTGDVDSHYFRLLAAVLIQGVLKGGAQAVSTAAAGAAGAGQVVVGVTGTGAQTGQQITGPLLSTKPTITVEAGQLANVILLNELKLPAMWANGEPHESTQAKRR